MNVLLKRRGDKYIAVYKANSELKVVFQSKAGEGNPTYVHVSSVK